MRQLSFKYTRDIKEFAPFLSDLMPDFGPIYLHTVLEWCKIIKSDPINYWKVWVIKKGNKSIGMCGLYALNKSQDELWLGWLGIAPEYRNNGLGKEVMEHLYAKAAWRKCKYILSYVDKDGKPLSFYKREGFEVLGTVGEYMRKNKMTKIDGESFEDPEDIVIRKKLI